MRGAQPFASQQGTPPTRARRLVVFAYDPRLVRRGEGPPLRPGRPRSLAGAHGTILPSLGGWHVRHRQSHLWWFPSRPACSDVYINLMSHPSLTERAGTRLPKVRYFSGLPAVWVHFANSAL